jgi:hypothetical protein
VLNLQHPPRNHIVAAPKGLLRDCVLPRHA